MFSSSVRRGGRLSRTAGSSRPSTASKRKRQPPNPRHFSRNSQLLLVSRPNSRPQLPYLYANPTRSSPFQQQVARLLSTETRKVIKDTVIGAIRLNVYFWLAIGLGSITYMGWRHETQEAKTPTPHDWSWWSRWHFREAKERQFPHQLQGFQAPNWVHVATEMKKVIERLEDPNVDGADITSALGEGEGAILVQGVSKTGADISGKSEPWRRGYFEALMTAGLAAEHVEGYVKDNSRDGAVFPPQVVIGPSNPKPRPMPLTKRGINEAPKEENCETFFDLPQVFYMKILTTAGFSNDQKLQAALAHADWLSFKGLSGSARDMYDWALDIASNGYKVGEEVPIDKETGILSIGSSPVTSNLLTATTSLAVHLARSGDSTAALPSFLSILQVQRQLPTGRQHADASTSDETKSPWSILASFIQENPYPPPPPSGDQPATRTADSACNEAGTLAHIGEILYTTPASHLPRALLQPPSSSKSTYAIEPTPAQAAGMAWTKRAVDLAEQSLESLCGRDRFRALVPGTKSTVSTPHKELGISQEELRKAKESCAACLEMAMVNWEQMVGRLAAREGEVQVARAKLAHPAAARVTDGAATAEGNAGQKSGSWFGSFGGGQGNAVADEGQVGKWIEEAGTVVHERKTDIRQMLREEKLPIREL